VIWHIEATKISCTGETGVGRLTGVKEGTIALKLTGCKGNGKECGNVKEGEIETKELKTLLAYGYPAKTGAEGREMGLVQTPVSGEVFAEFSCASAAIGAVSVKGAIMAMVSPLARLTKAFSLAIEQTSYVQEPAEYETESGERHAAVLTAKMGGGAIKKCGEEEVAPKLTLTTEEGTFEE
jgi:hypothetical protein